MMDEKDCVKYMNILEETQQMFGVMLYAYVLMGNHVHLLLKTPEANLSDFMRRLHLTYTGYVNRKYDRAGHLFQGRFLSHLVQEERYLTALSRYIHLNPIRVQTMKDKSVSEKIARLKDFQWSSLGGYLNQNKQVPLIQYDLLLKPHGGNTPSGRKKYWASLQRSIHDEQEDEFPGKLYGGNILGTREFAKEILERIRGKGATNQPPIQVLHRHVTEQELWERIESVTGQSKDQVLNSRGELRDVAIEALCRYAGLRGADVAKMFGLHESAVSKYRKRIRASLDKDENMSNLIQTLMT